MSRLEQLEKMYKADPEDPDLPYMLAQEYAGNGDFDRAIELFDACLANDSHYHYAYYHKAKTLQGLGKLDEAMNTLEKGLALAEEDRNAKAASEINEYLAQLRD